MQSMLCTGITWPSLPYRVRAMVLETGANAGALDTAAAVSSKLSFASDSGALCLLLVPMKQWLANLLACKSGKNLSSFYSP